MDLINVENPNVVQLTSSQFQQRLINNAATGKSQVIKE